MDTLSDNEVKSIWQRVKRYVNPENLKAGSREELAKEIEKQMQLSGETKKQGSIDALLRNGFADRVSGLDDVQSRYVDAETIEGKKFVAKRKKARQKELSPDLNKVRFNKKRTTIKTRKGYRSYKPQNINIVNGMYAGKPAYFISDVRTGKRISFGLIK